MKKTIMLIDDSVTIHRVIDLCVDKEQYDVVKVFSKDEALTAFKQNTPDLILLDNKLTDIKAQDMVSLIRQACGDCPVILLAGAFDQFDEQQCMMTGADDFIFKPFDAKTLDEKISAGLALAGDKAVINEPELVSDYVKEDIDEPEAEPEPESGPESDTETESEPKIDMPELSIEEGHDEALTDEELNAIMPESDEEEIKLPSFEEDEFDIGDLLSEESGQPDEPAVPEIEPYDKGEVPDIEAVEDVPEIPKATITPEETEEIPEIPEMPEEAVTIEMPESIEIPDLDDAIMDEEDLISEMADNIVLVTPEPTEAIPEDDFMQAVNESELFTELKGADEDDGDLFAGLKAIDEEELEKKEEPVQPEPVQAPETEAVSAPDADAEIKTDAAGDIFTGLKEADEMEAFEDDIKQEDAEAIVTKEEKDELDSLLDDINDETAASVPDISEAIESFEESLAESEMDMQNAASATDSADDFIGQLEVQIEEPDAVEISAPETEAEQQADAPEPEIEHTLDILAEEEDKKPFLISTEKLVEAVYEAIDEDTLKFAVKEVLTDKITRILEEELPILVERAIRKEIERLVKG